MPFWRFQNCQNVRNRHMIPWRMSGTSNSLFSRESVVERRPLATFSIRGTPGEIGLAIGRRFRDKIQAAFEIHDRNCRREYRLSTGCLRTAIARASCAARRRFPSYLDEIAGIAEGAGLDFAEVFLLNYIELPAVECDEACSTVIVRSNGGILIGHNEDWNPRHNDVYLLHARYPGGDGFECLCYYGILPGMSCGINTHGIAHAVNYLRPSDCRFGVPRVFLTRALLDARSLIFADKLICRRGRGFGQAIHLARGNQYRGYELTAKRIGRLPTGLPNMHTNHYLLGRLKRFESADDLRSTHSRLVEGLAQIANACGKQLTPRFVRSLLSSEESAPFSIWRSGFHKEDHGATLATALIDTANRRFRVWRKPA